MSDKKSTLTQDEINLLNKYELLWQPCYMTVPDEDGRQRSGVFGKVQPESPQEVKILLDALRKKEVDCAIRYEIQGIIGATKFDLKNCDWSGFAGSLKEITGKSSLITNLKLAQEMDRDPNEVFKKLTLEIVAVEQSLNEAGYKTAHKIVI